MGSILHSIIAPPFVLIKALVGWVDVIIDSRNPNIFQKAISYIFIPLFWLNDKLADRVDRNPFPMVYTSSDCSCKASNRLYYLSQKYTQKVSTLELAGNYYAMTAKFFVTIFSTFVAYASYKADIVLQQNI